MDLGTDLSWFSDVNGSWSDKDILVFSDGGFRSKYGVASAAWVVIERPPTRIDACGVYGSARILAKGATLITSNCSSSFMAEAIALEAATNVVRLRRVGASSSGSCTPFIFETAAVRPVCRY